MVIRSLKLLLIVNKLNECWWEVDFCLVVVAWLTPCFSSSFSSSSTGNWLRLYVSYCYRLCNGSGHAGTTLLSAEKTFPWAEFALVVVRALALSIPMPTGLIWEEWCSMTGLDSKADILRSMIVIIILSNKSSPLFSSMTMFISLPC